MCPSDQTGLGVAQDQTILENSACSLQDSFPDEFKEDFKVFDFGYYVLNKEMSGEVENIWNKIKSSAASQSPYYLLFGRIIDGQNKQFVVDLNLPNENIFSCIDQLSPNLRENLRLKYQAIANEIHEINVGNPQQYISTESQVMMQLSNYISELKDCCDFENRSVSSCSSCILTSAQYNSILDDYDVLSIDIDKIIESPLAMLGPEKIGYKIEVLGNLIDLDDSMTTFKQEIHDDYPSATIKIYPCNFSQTCTDFNNVINNFKTEDVDIGVLIGVVGGEQEKGTLRWQMISPDDVQHNPTSFGSDTCYYFNESKVFTNKEYCTGEITPRGILQNLDGFSFDLEFRFADPELTPRTLTTEPLTDGELVEYSNAIREPLLNKAYIMNKTQIFSQIASAIPDEDGNSQLTAFDYHLFAPWSLLIGSGGSTAPFDFSAKTFFFDRENYLFITDDGENIVGHNYRNMGNFLWGAATYIMGVPQFMALGGAHYQNILGEFGDGGLDSPDDQYSIRLGRYYAKKMDWKTIYGGKNNIFRE